MEIKFLAPRPGLEPGTSSLTGRRSTDWAIAELKILLFTELSRNKANNSRKEPLIKYVRIASMEKINQEEFAKLSQEWTALDTEYDNLFQAFLDNPHVKDASELESFKAMQKRLYAIEDELYKIAEGKMVID